MNLSPPRSVLLKKVKRRRFIRKTLWPFMASASGGLLMLLAFFVPAMQDQWDRFESRKIVNQYIQIGDDLYEDEKYNLAEKIYQKAFELSGNNRLEIDIKRLEAKVARISLNASWGTKPPEDIDETDFEFLLHVETTEKDKVQRMATLNAYGIFLSSLNRTVEAEEIFKEAVDLDSTDAVALINLGNLYDQKNQKANAEKFYLKGLRLDPENAQGHYNLGLLLVERKQFDEAEKQFEQVLISDPTDEDAKRELNALRELIVNQK